MLNTDTLFYFWCPQAAELGDEAIVSCLLQEGADVHVANIMMMTALHQAAMAGKPAIVYATLAILAFK